MTTEPVNSRITLAFGDVAQLGERSVRNAEAEGSNPFISTTPSDDPPFMVGRFLVSVETMWATFYG